MQNDDTATALDELISEWRKLGCQRCGALNTYLRRLVGGVTVRICADCNNDWRDVAETFPAVNRLRELELRYMSIAVAARGVNSSDLYHELSHIWNEMRELLRGDVRAVATKWAAEKITRGEATKPMNETQLQGGVVLHGGTDEQMALLKARGAFSEQYCAERGWNMDELTLDQILEIRKQPGWDTPQK